MRDDDATRRDGDGRAADARRGPRAGQTRASREGPVAGACGRGGRGTAVGDRSGATPARPWQRDRTGQPTSAPRSSSSPRRGPERGRGRSSEPAVPEGITGAELDREVRSELLTLSKENAAAVARHLVAAGLALDSDPERAYAHAAAAAGRAGRVGSVREAAGLAAYAAGRYEDAIRELRTARRLTGSDVHLPVLADCERGLGRPERALDLAATPAVSRLDVAGRIEMRIVAAGARRDLGQAEAAVVSLQGPELSSRGREPWRARLLSAYADALAAAGREAESQAWLERAAAADPGGETGAAERLRGASGGADRVVVWDLLDDGPDDGPDDGATGPARRR